MRFGREFHPAKCSVMRVASSKKPYLTPQMLKGHHLQAETNPSKYLSVDISNNLDWKPRIDRITKKSNSILGFLRHNRRISSQETKTLAYIVLLHSNHGILCHGVESIQEGAHLQTGDGTMLRCLVSYEEIQKHQLSVRHT